MRRSFWVPEVVQTSGMDCGPASLKALLGGLGIHVGYGALREAANTDLDGTSIDTMEDLAVALGADASQVVIPRELLLLDVAQNLPCIAVVKTPGGAPHFIVVWRVVAGWVQVMDPAVGRRWMRPKPLLARLYHHEMAVPREAWVEHAASPEYLAPLHAELVALGLSAATASQKIAAAAREELGVEKLEAAMRLVAAMRDAAPMSPAQREELLDHCSQPDTLLPEAFYTVRPTVADSDEEPKLTLSGVIALRIRGTLRSKPPPSFAKLLERTDATSLAPLWALVLSDGLARPLLAAGAAALSASLSVISALVFRGLVDLTGDFATVRHRLAGLGTIAALVAIHALIDRASARTLSSIGRSLEVKLRLMLYDKLPRLDDVYYRTRLVSDLADRAHAMHHIGEIPALYGAIWRYGLELAMVVFAIGLIDPLAALPAMLGAAVVCAVPALASPLLTERERAAREHKGAVSRLFLDALLSAWTVRAHVADGVLRVEHEKMMVAWATSARLRVSTQIGVDTLSTLAGIALAAAVLAVHTSRAGWTGAALLLVWWSLLLPSLGERINTVFRAIPEARNIALRLLEPLSGPEPASIEGAELTGSRKGLRVEMRQVTVSLGGSAVLSDVTLAIEPDQHVAIVGRSGSGKSTLVATLLGFYEAQGSILIDGAPVAPSALRAVTRWIDPAVWLWNQSVVDNLRYGSEDVDLEQVLIDADLLETVGHLPDGLQTDVGEGGGRLSGGEGQRLRIGRGLARKDVRLVLLDEAFRGLDRQHRGRMLDRIRARSRGATLVCVTHDAEHALTFDRVIAIDGGRIIEEGAPTELAARPGSHFAALLAAEGRVLDRQRVAFTAAQVSEGHLVSGPSRRAQ